MNLQQLWPLKHETQAGELRANGLYPAITKAEGGRDAEGVGEAGRGKTSSLSQDGAMDNVATGGEYFWRKLAVVDVSCMHE